MESVSLIDKQTEAKAADGEPKGRTTFLPPISRLRSRGQRRAASQPPPPAPAPVGRLQHVEQPTISEAESHHRRGRSEERHHIKPPIIVKELATQLGVKNFQLIKELMATSTFS